MKPQELRSADGTHLRSVGSDLLVTQVSQRVAQTGFLFVDNLAVNVLLGTTFIGEDFEAIAPEKRLICSIGSHPVAILGTDRD